MSNPLSVIKSHTKSKIVNIGEINEIFKITMEDDSRAYAHCNLYNNQIHMTAGDGQANELIHYIKFIGYDNHICIGLICKIR